jgi:hypothetical protein
MINPYKSPPCVQYQLEKNLSSYGAGVLSGTYTSVVIRGIVVMAVSSNVNSHMTHANSKTPMMALAIKNTFRRR